METLFAVLIDGCLIGVAAVLGRCMFVRLYPERPPPTTLMPLAIAFGLVPVLLFFNVVLVCGVLHPAVTVIGCAIVLAVCRQHVAPCVREVVAPLRRFLRSASAPGRFFVPAWIVIIMIALAGVGVLAPSTAFDSSVYHFTLPKLYALAGGYVPRPDIAGSTLTQNLSGIHAAVFQIGGENAIELLNTAVCVLMVWLIYGLVMELWNHSDAAVGAALVPCAAILFILYLYDADVEGWLAYLLLSLFATLWLAEKEMRPAHLIMIAALGGCLLGTKVTPAPAVGLAFLFAFARCVRRGKRVPWLHIAGAAAVASLLAFSWYALIYGWHGDVYGKGFFAMDEVSRERVPFLIKIPAAIETVLKFNLPFVAFLFLLPLRKTHRVSRDVGVVCVIVIPLILVTNPWGQAFHRYTFPLLPLMAIAMADVLRTPAAPGWSWAKAARLGALGLVLAGLAATLAANGYRNLRKLKVALNIENRDDYLAARINSYRTSQAANEAVGDGKLFMVVARSYWLDVPYILGTDRSLYIDYAQLTPEQFFQVLDRHRITHLMFSDVGVEGNREFNAFWHAHPELRQHPRLELIRHDRWPLPDGPSSAWLYRVANLSLPAN